MCPEIRAASCGVLLRRRRGSCHRSVFGGWMRDDEVGINLPSGHPQKPRKTALIPIYVLACFLGFCHHHPRRRTRWPAGPTKEQLKDKPWLLGLSFRSFPCFLVFPEVLRASTALFLPLPHHCAPEPSRPRPESVPKFDQGGLHWEVCGCQVPSDFGFLRLCFHAATDCLEVRPRCHHATWRDHQE